MFEKMTGTPSCARVIAIEEAEAARLMFGHCRDTGEALECMKSNPWAQMKAGEHCRVRWNPELAKIGRVLAEAEYQTGV